MKLLFWAIELWSVLSIFLLDVIDSSVSLLFLRSSVTIFCGLVNKTMILASFWLSCVYILTWVFYRLASLSSLHMNANCCSPAATQSRQSAKYQALFSFEISSLWLMLIIWLCILITSQCNHIISYREEDKIFISSDFC